MPTLYQLPTPLTVFSRRKAGYISDGVTGGGRGYGGGGGFGGGFGGGRGFGGGKRDFPGAGLT